MAEIDLLALISLGLVVMIGLPHGALDGAVAMTVGYGRRLQDIVKFSVIYIMIALLVVIVWMVIPIFSLTLFMLISMIHFGLGDHNAAKPLAKYIQVICHGGLVVALIPIIHFAEVEPIFLTLTGAVHPAQLSSLWGLLIVLGGVFVLAALGYAFLAIREKALRGRFLEFLGLGLALTVLPPLSGFALYFCFIHTPRHIRGVVKAVINHHEKTSSGETSILPLTIVFTVITWAVAGLILMFKPDNIAFSDAVLRLIFIGLAALTVPHMMLVDGVFRPKHLNPLQESTRQTES